MGWIYVWVGTCTGPGKYEVWRGTCIGCGGGTYDEYNTGAGAGTSTSLYVLLGE